MVEPGRSDADEIHRHRRRVEQRQPVADLLHLGVDLHRVAGGRVEADGLALAELGAGGDALDGAAVALEIGLVALEIVDRLGLECDVLEPVAVGTGEHQRVVILLVPPFQVDVVLVAGHLPQTQHLGVVSGTEL